MVQLTVKWSWDDVTDWDDPDKLDPANWSSRKSLTATCVELQKFLATDDADRSVHTEIFDGDDQRTEKFRTVSGAVDRLKELAAARAASARVCAVEVAFEFGPEVVEQQLQHAEMAYSSLAYGATAEGFPAWECTADDGELRSIGHMHVPRAGDADRYAAVLQLAFRGSSNTSNWMTNFEFNLVPSRLGAQVGQVHGGFQRAYFALQSDLRAKLRKGAEALGIGGDKPVLVLITGHSLGGALAMVAAYDFATMDCPFRLMVHCLTFGSPRVGDARFAKDYNQAVKRTQRFVNELDPAPRVPPNPSDPNDDGAVLGEVMRGIVNVSINGRQSEYVHVCKGTQLQSAGSEGVVEQVTGAASGMEAQHLVLAAGGAAALLAAALVLITGAVGAAVAGAKASTALDQHGIATYRKNMGLKPMEILSNPLDL